MISESDLTETMIHQQLDSPATMLFDMLKSIAYLTYLLIRREKLHPDILHFITCLYEDQVHLLWAFSLWACYKTLFIPPTGSARMSQIAVLSGIEIAVALLFSFSFGFSNLL